MRWWALALTSCLVWAGSAATAVAASSAVDRAFDRGASCLLDDLDQGRFGDPYLSFVYPGERLPATSTGPLTYRQVDAYLVLALIGRAGPVSPELATEIERADNSLAEAARLWVGRGFNNTLRDSDLDGIGLDTYCMVGWLADSSAMADEVAGALVDDRWLPERWYEGDEAYRAIADEAWCVRLLAGQARHTATAVRLLERLGAEAATQVEASAPARPVDPARFYTAWHLGMLAADLETGRPRRSGAEPPIVAAVAREAVETFERWATSHAPDDLLEWANLAGAEILRRFEQRGARLKERAIARLLESQHPDGCWSFGGDVPQAGQRFLTLRALLALQRYRSAGSSARANPAP